MVDDDDEDDDEDEDESESEGGTGTPDKKKRSTSSFGKSKKKSIDDDEDDDDGIRFEYSQAGMFISLLLCYYYYYLRHHCSDFWMLMALFSLLSFQVVTTETMYQRPRHLSNARVHSLPPHKPIQFSTYRWSIAQREL